jgi:hypothetical protein
MVKIKFIAVSGLFLMLAQQTFSKRASPAEVAPALLAGVEYVAPHVTRGYNDQHGVPQCLPGCVEAWDRKGDKLLWRIQVYNVQDIQIRSLQILNGVLVVGNERGAKYSVDLKSHVVKKWKQPLR